MTFQNEIDRGKTEIDYMIVCQETDNIDELKNLVEMKETVLKHTCALLRNVQVIGTSESVKEKEVQAIELERIEQNFKKRQLAVRTSNETKEIELRAEREAKRKQLMQQIRDRQERIIPFQNNNLINANKFSQISDLDEYEQMIQALGVHGQDAGSIRALLPPLITSKHTSLPTYGISVNKMMKSD